jgi:hypothetical protein
MIISGLLLIAVAVTGSVLFYSYSMKLMGGLQGPAPQMMDNLRIEAYNWNSMTWVNVTVRNTGTNIVPIGTAQWFVAGVLQTTVASCTGSLNPGIACTAKITVSGVTVTSGIVYVVKIILSDGAIFAASAIAGQVSGQTGVT